MPISQPAISTEYVRLGPIILHNADGTLYNPTADTITITFINDSTGGSPTTGDWKTASWFTDTSNTTTAYYAEILVGPTATTLTAGVYTVWLKITDSPEIPARPVDTLTIT